MFFFNLKTQFVPHSKHSTSRLLTIYQLILYTAKLAVCLDIRTEHINAFCGQNAEFFYVKPGLPYNLLTMP